MGEKAARTPAADGKDDFERGVVIADAVDFPDVRQAAHVQQTVANHAEGEVDVRERVGVFVGNALERFIGHIAQGQAIVHKDHPFHNCREV